MELENITLVIHDWGSGLGFNFAYQNQERIKGIAFMEALVKPRAWSDFSCRFPHWFSTDAYTVLLAGLWLAWGKSVLSSKMLPQAIHRELTETEMAVYAKPYPTIASRKPLLQWPREVPIDNSPSDMHQIITDYSQWLQQTDIPKLFFYATPGAIIDDEVKDWVMNSFPNLTSHDMGTGIHFVQEDNPHFIGQKIAEWYRSL